MVAELIMVSRRKGERVQGDIIMEGRKEGWSVGWLAGWLPPSFLPSFLYSREGDRRSGKELSDRDGREEANDEERERGGRGGR